MLNEIYKTPERLIQLMDTYNLSNIEGLIDEGLLKKIRNVILTGCGEERYAAEAVKPVFENKKDFKGTGMFPGIEVYPMSVVDFSRYYCTYRGWHPQRKDKHLVIVADQDGENVNAIECVNRAKNFGSPAIAITSSFENRLGETASYQMCIDFEENFTYMFSAEVYLMTLLGIKLSLVQGFLSYDQTMDILKSLHEYADAFREDVILCIDEELRAVAAKWKKKEINMVQFTGSSQDYAVAGWGSNIFMKYAGISTSVDDLEGWCHVDIFTAPNESIGCVVVIRSKSMAISRAEEVIQVMRSLGREVLVITDAITEGMEGADIVLLPGCAYEFGAPMLQQIPLSLLMAHMMEE